MGQIPKRLRSLKDRLSGSRSAGHDADAAERALRKQEAKAQRLEHKRAADKDSNTWR
jgi:hypothetical protein